MKVDWRRLSLGNLDAEDVLLYHFDANGYCGLRSGFQDQGELRPNAHSTTVVVTDDELLILAALLPEVRALVETLRDLEWVENERGYEYCYVCGEEKGHPHLDNCNIALALAPFLDSGG